MRPIFAPYALVLMGSASTLSYAQAVPPDESGTPMLPSIVISAEPGFMDEDELTPPANVLTGERLILNRAGTLGDLLEGEPGVHADSFGAGAGRPVIRGQTLPRLKILSDGSEILDASAVSPDHVISVDTGQARQVEILRGPSALRYAGNAIAGVVNVLDHKIPTAIPAEGIEGSVEVSGATAARERFAAAGITAGQGNLALRVEGTRRRADDYRVPHWTESRVRNSDVDNTSGSVGVSWVGSRGFLGTSYSYRTDDYGLPGHSHQYEDCHPHGSTLHCAGHHQRHQHDHHQHDHGDDDTHAEHVATAHLRSHRADVRGELHDPFAGFSTLKFRGGYTDYRHEEREDGILGTTFTNRGFDGRLELVHEPVAGWNGIIGMQASQNDFASFGGSENFVPPTRTQGAGVFLLENYVWNDWRFDFGARHDWQRIRPESGDVPGFNGQATSFSAGAEWEFAAGYALSASVARTHRMPTAQELYSYGQHLATLTYELGSPSLDKETAATVEVGLKKSEGEFQFALNVFLSRIDNYIYGNTLDRYDDFRLVQYTQADAMFSGLEAEVSYSLSGSTVLSAFGDYVRGRLLGAGNLPRIPAARAGARVKYEHQNWGGFVEYVQVMRQSRITDFEEESASYGLLGAGVSYRGKLAGTNYLLYLKGTNLLNRLGYNHASFISREAPLRGRNVTAGLRVEF